MLGALSAFLRFLNSAPHPDDVASELVTGPGSTFGARAGAVTWAHGSQLVFLGSHGFLDDEVSGLDTMPLDIDRPMCHAFRENEVVIDDVSELAQSYADVAHPLSNWPVIRERLSIDTVVNAPITCRGLPVGVYTLNCEGPAAWHLPHLPLLRAISHALGLWLTHPDSGVPVEDPGNAIVNPERPTLTDRQRTLLRLIAAGKTNASIAVTLGVSASTIKQETQRLARQLGTSGRLDTTERARQLGLLQRDAP